MKEQESGVAEKGNRRGRGIMRGLCDPPLIISPDGSAGIRERFKQGFKWRRGNLKGRRTPRGRQFALPSSFN